MGAGSGSEDKSLPLTSCYARRSQQKSPQSMTVHSVVSNLTRKCDWIRDTEAIERARRIDLEGEGEVE